jgi:hypothetical protein
MAFWASTGPEGKTCRECRFFRADGYYAKGGKHRGALKPATCARYSQMMQGAMGNKFDGATFACKYFEENTTPPAAFAKG